MKYEILKHTNRNELEKIVCSYLKGGWSLQGGVAVAVKVSDDDPYFFQAVTKR